VSQYPGLAITSTPSSPKTPAGRRASQQAFARTQYDSSGLKAHLEGLSREVERMQAELMSLEEENRRLMRHSTSKESASAGSPRVEPKYVVGEEGLGSPTSTIDRMPSGFSLSVRKSAMQGDTPERHSTTSNLKIRKFFLDPPHGHNLRPSATNASVIFSAGHQDSMESDRATKSWCACKALDPSSPARLAFECLTVLVCLHDAIYVPFSLAWDPAPSDTTRIIGFLTLSFWFTDMILNFFTGFYKEGALIIDIKRIAFRYLATFFVIDITINGVDLFSIAMEVLLDQEQSSPSLRVLRIVKLNRLLRVAVLFNRYKDKFKGPGLGSSSFTMVGLAMRLVAILFFLNHLICCSWYWIGANADLYDTGVSWLDLGLASSGMHYREASMQMQYLTSLHWAFTQMTPGSMAVVPQNSYERAWNCFVLIIGLFVSALLISQLSAKMVRVQTLNHDRLSQMELLTRFLSEQGVHRSLAMRIRRQVRERSQRTKPLTVADVPSLALLPMTLRQELSCAIFSRTFLSHTIFYVWACLEDAIVEDVSSRAIELEACSRADDIFIPLQEAKKVFNLRVGTLSYKRMVFTSDQAVSRGQSLRSGGISFSETNESLQNWDPSGEAKLLPRAWISMVALWCKWSYLGSCQASEDCELVALNVTGILEVLERYPALFKINRCYATCFCQLMSDPEHSKECDLDILPAQVMMAADADDRFGISCVVVDSFMASSSVVIDQYVSHRRDKIKPSSREILVEELDQGKCVVSLGVDGQLLRSVLISVLCIQRESGDVLTKLATTKGSKWVAECVLPASKLREQENFRQAAERLLAKDLPDLNGTLDWDTPEIEQSITQSGTTGIRTTYMKSKFQINFFSCGEDSADVSGVLVNNMASMNRPRVMVSKSMSSQPAAPQFNFSKLKIIEVTKNPDKPELFAWLPLSLVTNKTPILIEELQAYLDLGSEALAHQISQSAELRLSSASKMLDSDETSEGPQTSIGVHNIDTQDVLGANVVTVRF